MLGGFFWMPAKAVIWLAGPGDRSVDEAGPGSVAASPWPGPGTGVEPLGPLVSGLPAHFGRSHSPPAHPAPLVQPSALAAHCSPLCSGAGLACGAPFFFVEFTINPKPSWRWLLMQLPSFWYWPLLLCGEQLSSIGSGLCPTATWRVCWPRWCVGGWLLWRTATTYGGDLP